MGFISLISFTLFLVVASQAKSSDIHDEYRNCLHSQNSAATISGVTYYSPNSSSYPSIFHSAVRNFGTLASKSISSPDLIITPSHESEIQTALRCATKTNIQIRVRSGGHDYEGLSYTSATPFVLIDLRNFRSISVDIERKTAWVKSGAALGEVYHKIAAKSNTLAFAAGVCPTVGVGGHFSGGGYSMMSRKFGLAIDNIIDAKVMDVNGEILDGRESMGEDLFWAIRGGGGTSFGIVLAWKIKLVSVPEKVTVFNVTKTLEQNATKLLERWQHVASRMDRRLLIRVFINTLYSFEDRKKSVYVSFTSLFLGGADDLLEKMRKSFPELALEKEDCKEMNWIESLHFLATPFLDADSNIDSLLSRNRPKVHFKGKSDYVTQPISLNGWKAICDRLLGEGEFPSQLQLSPHGGRMSEISESATPFPHRAGTLFMVHYIVKWKNEEEGIIRRNWMRRFYQFMASYVSKFPRGAYFNYRDLDLGDAMNNDADNSSSWYEAAARVWKTSYLENNFDRCVQFKTHLGDSVSEDSGMNSKYQAARVWGTKYFKQNFDRLVFIKSKVDPHNFFRNEQSIPPIHTSNAAKLTEGIYGTLSDMSIIASPM